MTVRWSRPVTMASPNVFAPQIIRANTVIILVMFVILTYRHLDLSVWRSVAQLWSHLHGPAYCCWPWLTERDGLQCVRWILIVTGPQALFAPSNALPQAQLDGKWWYNGLTH